MCTHNLCFRAKKKKNSEIVPQFKNKDGTRKGMKYIGVLSFCVVISNENLRVIRFELQNNSN